ncbi:MAG: hypothetical protein HYS27_01025 [Deltaproteobacteria bacterium]|nr:hypothetical protein [Deltaproteobacteria bacterium]
MRAGFSTEDGEVTLAYDEPTHLRAIAVATGQLVAYLDVTAPPGVELAIAPNEGATYLSAANDEERAYARLTDSRGTLFEGGTFFSLAPVMNPPALVEIEEDGQSTCIAANGSLTRSVVAHLGLDEPIDLRRGEYAYGELGGIPAFAMLPDAAAVDHRGDPPTEDGADVDTSYGGHSAVFRLAEAAAP